MSSNEAIVINGLGNIETIRLEPESQTSLILDYKDIYNDLAIRAYMETITNNILLVTTKTPEY